VIERVDGLDSVNSELAELIVDARWPQAGANKSNTYTGDGYLTLRHRDTERVKTALDFIAHTVRISYSHAEPVWRGKKDFKTISSSIDQHGRWRITVTAEAPRAFNRDDVPRSSGECFSTALTTALRMVHSAIFAEIKAHYENVAPERREDIHMISVVGGLYGLNLIPLWKPKRLTIFDINPTAVTYFNLIRRVWTTSDDVAQFLQRLTDGDYEASTEREQFVRENIRLKHAEHYRASVAQPSVRTSRAGNMRSNISTSLKRS
jgi:hypothetical protein